jgi:hypothetical protein
MKSVFSLVVVVLCFGCTTINSDQMILPSRTATHIVRLIAELEIEKSRAPNRNNPLCERCIFRRHG